MNDVENLLNRKPIYQLKIRLEEIEPSIWRRVLVSGNVSMKTVHMIFQVAMGWTNSHLHIFEFPDGSCLSDPEFELMDDPVPGDESKTKLRKVAPRVGSLFYYRYDFGDDWLHEVVVEDILLPGPSGRVPRCIAGENQCPPEDCGGPWGYYEFVHAMKDPNHPAHKDMVEWYGRDFDPREFDIKGVNQRLRRLG